MLSTSIGRTRVRPFVALVCAIALLTLGSGAAATTGATSRWYRVTYAAPIAESDRLALVAAGAEGVQYVPQNSYLAYLSAGEAAVVGGLANVAGVAALTAADKLDDSLPAVGQASAVVLVARSQLAGAAQRFGATVVRAAGALGEVFVRADAAVVRSFAARDDVVYVGPAPTGIAFEDEASDQLVAGNVNAQRQPVRGYESWLAQTGLSGAGVKVSVVDSGVDGTHPDLAGRVTRVEQSLSPSGEPGDTGGHGTHVAGIVAGDAAGIAALGRTADANGFLYGLGVAPDAHVVDLNVLSYTAGGPLCGVNWPPPAWAPFTEDSISAGSHVWNASWQSCEGTGVGYIQSVATLDGLVRDGSPSRTGAQPFTMVFSAGNSGAGTRPDETRLTAPHEGKNLIVVASSVNRGGSPETIATSSSRGPAVDGRIVPTIAAPGNGVISTRSSTGTNACNQPLTNAGAAGALYASCSGTSMAAPHVTGSVALITEWWRKQSGGSDPSPALSKAFLVNTATDLGAQDVPNRHEGWGRVNLGELFDSSAKRVITDQSDVLTDVGQQRSFRIAVADPTKPLRVTLAWTDAPGAAGANPALVNDLDLTVQLADGRTVRGNNFLAGRSVAGGEPDRLNNLENVHFDGASGEVVVTVAAAALPGDGVPITGDGTDQDYALVISNGVAVP